jgi:nitrite reductase (NO-forming)
LNNLDMIYDIIKTISNRRKLNMGAAWEMVWGMSTDNVYQKNLIGMEIEMKPISPQKNKILLALFLAVALMTSACGGTRQISELKTVNTGGSNQTGIVQPVESDNTVPLTAQSDNSLPSQTKTIQYELKTVLGSGGMEFVGVGGEIDGISNPNLQVDEGVVVEITLTNDDGMEHDVVFPDFEAYSDKVSVKGKQTKLVFTAGKSGTYPYYCSIPGHRQAGMEGKLVVGHVVESEAATAPSIVRDPADVPGPLPMRQPQSIQYEIETVELEGHLADGSTFTYWTFDKTVPGPFLRVRTGDTVEVTLTNPAESTMTHSIDFHAVTGPGGGAAVTQAAPGESKSFTFKALNPGLYVYHCATPMVAHHIANGMYGMILVEPEEGLPEVDHEFYVMQGEIYTQAPLGEAGRHEISIDKLLAEDPEYFVFNGAVGALTEATPMVAKTGETVRIYFGVGGPNFVSSFHVIGEIFDNVYDQGSITSPPLTDVQTTLVAPGGSTVVEFTLEVPGRYILVDHALSRAERGLVGFLIVEGPENHDVFFSEETPGAGGH